MPCTTRRRSEDWPVSWSSGSRGASGRRAPGCSAAQGAVEIQIAINDAIHQVVLFDRGAGGAAVLPAQRGIAQQGEERLCQGLVIIRLHKQAIDAVLDYIFAAA